MSLSHVLAPLIGLRRRDKRLIQVAVDILLLCASFAGAMALRLDGWSFVAWPQVWLTLVLVVPPTIALFVVMGFYRAIVRYVDDAAMRTVVIGVGASGMLMAAVALGFTLSVPRSVPAIYMLLALFSVGGVRLAMRATYRRSQNLSKAPVIIYGAGSSGRQLLAALIRGAEYSPVAFVDDARKLQGADLSGVRVHAPSYLPMLIARTGAKTLLLAMPRLSRAQRKGVLDRLDKLPVRVRTVPGSADLVSGRAEVADLRDVAVEDLLGRDPVPPRPDLMDANIRGKVVMVTGAGGSIGAELCRQILNSGPATLILFEMSEFMLYQIDAELQRHVADAAHGGAGTGDAGIIGAGPGGAGMGVRIVPVLGSVCDTARMRAVLAAWRVQTVYHAAAYKHVPMVEMNVVDGVLNNVFGTAVAAQAAVAEGVQAFILISTDKAVRPTNVMGATKRMAELICQAWAGQQDVTRFSMVRFGNVLGSSGSVIPLFHRQIAAGGPITVTHPEITRYFMTIPEAAQLVIQAGALARGGDVFVLDMGEPVRIVDLAARMARLYGLMPVIQPPVEPQPQIQPPGQPGTGPGPGPGIEMDGGDIAITFSALRPGEKLYEELLIGDDATATAHSQIKTAHEVMLPMDALTQVLATLSDACARGAVPDIKQCLKDAGTGYVPDVLASDLVWLQNAGSGHAPRMAAE